MNSQLRLVVVLMNLVVLVGAGSWIAAAQEAEPYAPPDAAEEMTPEQQEMMAAWQAAMAPGEEHARLADTSGRYRVEYLVYGPSDPQAMGVDPEPVLVMQGTAHRVPILNGRAIREELTAGQEVVINTIGYDNTLARYWQTSMSTSSTGLITALGDVNEETGNLEFTEQVTDPWSGATMPFRVVRVMTDEGEVWETYDLSSGDKVADIVYSAQCWCKDCDVPADCECCVHTKD